MHLLNKLVLNVSVWTTRTLTAECMVWPLGHYAHIEGDLLISSDGVDGSSNSEPLNHSLWEGKDVAVIPVASIDQLVLPLKALCFWLIDYVVVDIEG